MDGGPHAALSPRATVFSEPVLEIWIRPDNKAESGSKAEHIWNM
ncbi:uncharacterized protein Dvar_31620 [Desulfosarcina variabilis str. Montpellier]